MYLVDSNVWLELLLDQANSKDVANFLGGIDSTLLAITEFSLYSIGIILTGLKKDKKFEDFLTDNFEYSNVSCVRLDFNDLKDLLSIKKQWKLDFDDAYQYTAAEKFDLTIVSFDKDFDKTDRGRKLPGEIVNP